MADGGENQEGKDRGYFKANGLDHFSFTPKTVITWGLLSIIAGLIFATLSIYQSFGTNVDERISNHRELNRKLDKHEFEIDNLKADSKELGSRLTDIEKYINSKGRK